MKALSTIEQEEAFEKLSRLKVGALFMEMGTGKTKVALDLIASKNNKIDYILWICPYSLKTEIENERLKWHPELNIEIIGCESIGSSDRIYLDILAKTENNRTFVIVDESLKIKNRKAKRTKRIIEIGKKSEYRLILNGTPISKNYCDLWSQMQFLSEKILDMTYNEFFNTYCEYYTSGNKKGRIKSFVNIPHLIDRISPYVFEAKLSIDTTKNYYTHYYYTNTHQYNLYKDELISELFDYENNDIEFYKLILSLQRFYTRNSDREEKIKKVVDLIDESVIIFVRFVDSIPEGAKKITGSEKTDERRRIIERFKNKEFKVLYITYGCGAYGLNLQFCKNIIFAEHTWDYAVREQAEARIYRIGQEAEVNYYDMVCSGIGLEDLIFRCIRRKEDMLNIVKSEIQKLEGEKKQWLKSI